MWSSSCGPASPNSRSLASLKQSLKTLWTFCITEKFVSVAMEEVKSQDWVEKVYKPDVKGKWDKVYKKPGYDESDL